MDEQPHPTSHLIVRGGQVPTKTTLNGEGAQSTKQLNTHAGGDEIKSLMAQQAEFNASIMKTVNKLSKRKNTKNKRNSRYSGNRKSL